MISQQLDRSRQFWKLQPCGIPIRFSPFFHYTVFTLKRRGRYKLKTTATRPKHNELTPNSIRNGTTEYKTELWSIFYCFEIFRPPLHKNSIFVKYTESLRQIPYKKFYLGKCFFNAIWCKNVNNRESRYKRESYT